MATVTGTEQDVWPPRALVTASGLVAADAVTVTIYREVAGVRTILRGADTVVTSGNDAVVRTDAELPFGVPVRWVAEITTTTDVVEATSSPLTVDIEKVALSDAISGLAAQVVILAWPDKAHARASSVFQVGGRTVVVSGQRSGFESAIDVVIESDSAREQFETLLDEATSGVLQIRQDGGYGGVDSYVAVLSDTESRWSQDGSDPRRRWTVNVTQVEGWASALEARGFTLADLNAAFDFTLAELEVEFPGNLLDIAQAEF